MQITGSRESVVEPPGREDPMGQRTSSGSGDDGGGYISTVPFLPFSLVLSLPLSMRAVFSSFCDASITLVLSLSISRLLVSASKCSVVQRSRFPRFELSSTYLSRRCRLVVVIVVLLIFHLPPTRYFDSSCSSSTWASRGSYDRYGPIYFRSRQRRCSESRLRA